MIVKFIAPKLPGQHKPEWGGQYGRNPIVLLKIL